MVVSGRTLDHGASAWPACLLFTVIKCALLTGGMAMLKRDAAAGFGDASRRFAAVTLFAFVRRPGVRKRLPNLLMASMMTPATPRASWRRRPRKL